MTICNSCKREYVYSRKSGHTKTKCNTCLVNDRRFKVKEDCLNYLGNKCSICGYDKCKRALEFHHIDPSKKEFIISGSHCRSWEKIKQELDKCILVCSNCHAELHEKLDS
jgi:predicted HNH restriction endonuclease